MRAPSAIAEQRLPGLVLTDHRFELPLDHARPEGRRLGVFAREVVAAGREGDALPWLLFLQGGPGFEGPRPSGSSGWLGRALQDHRVLLLDQRGTGRSAPVDARALAALGGPLEQAEHLTRFRADAIVRDAEAIRRALLGPEERWTVLGQSFGGFCLMRYLSAAPEGLAGGIFTGGLPDLERHCDEVYARTYPLVAERNRRFYARYPDDVERARRVAARLAEEDVRLPCGDRLSVRRFQQLGLLLGASDGAESLHWLLERASVDGPADAVSSLPFLRGVENALAFDTNPLYAALHEACYAQGVATRWSAQRVRADFPEFEPRAGEPLFFTGEMVYPWMFEEQGALSPLREAAQLLAEKDDWPRLYDVERLARNTVPCAAAVYYEDMYVPRELSEGTLARVPGIRAWVTSEYEHNALRADGERLLSRLLDLLAGRE